MNAVAPILAGDGDDEFRSSVVGASEVAALFDCHPWLTHFELFHRKNGTIDTPDFGGNERVEWGIRLEPAIIEAAKDRYGYTDREQIKHLDNGKGMGGHPDRRVTCPARGPGILEVKMVDWLERKKWGDEPPTHYLLQNQTYQGLDQCQWGDVIVLVGGNSLERFQYDFRPKLYAEIESRVAIFWQDVRSGNAPTPDFARDGKTLIDVLGAPDDTLIDLRHDCHASDLAAEWLEAKAAIKAAETRADVAKCELMLKVGSAGAAMLDGYRIAANETKGSSGTLITAEMVGTYVGARKGYRRFGVKEKS